MTIICFILIQIAMAYGFFALGMGVCNYLHVSHSGRDKRNVSNNCGCHSGDVDLMEMHFKEEQ